eukprot:3727929-Amphidinium_carterae.1
MAEDVERLQQHKQHHVHLPGDKAGDPRKPLAHCRDPKNPLLCKAGFPRTHALTDESIVLCEALAKKMNMPTSGKR